MHTEDVADGDVQRYADAMTAPPVDMDAAYDSQFATPERADHTSWPREATVDYRVPMAARGEIATQLLDTANKLGYPVAAIRSQTDGFLVPAAVYYHLFPSQDPDAE